MRDYTAIEVFTQNPGLIVLRFVVVLMFLLFSSTRLASEILRKLYIRRLSAKSKGQYALQIAGHIVYAV